MEYRNATLSDLKAVQMLNDELFDLEYKHFDKNVVKNWPLSKQGKAYFENAIKKDCVIVAVEHDKVIGYILGAETKVPYYSFKTAELCNMCVTASYRGKGIGAKLVEKFENHFAQKGITYFTVTASYKNEYAKAFYKKLGYKENNITYIK